MSVDGCKIYIPGTESDDYTGSCAADARSCRSKEIPACGRINKSIISETRDGAGRADLGQRQRVITSAAQESNDIGPLRIIEHLT